MDWNQLKGYKPEVMADEEDFPKLNGKYVCTIESCLRKQGTSQKSGEAYDFLGMKLRVVETVAGDKGNNRILDCTFNYDETGLKRLSNSLFTAGLESDVSSEEAIDKTVTKAIGNQVNIRAWVWKEKDSQQIRFVNKFKVKKALDDKTPSTF